jgi:Holliday junction DNA helicase RuvA
VVRDDGWTLYGFAASSDRRLFQRLLGTTGVGPSLAMNLLSTLTAERLVRAIQEKDLAALTRVPRVGKKLAERLVLELRDKLAVDGALPSSERAAVPAGASFDAVRALAALGYGTADAEQVVLAVLESDGKLDTAELIRRALARMSRR